MTKMGFAKDQLKAFVNRAERLEAEKDALSSDLKEIFAEAKSSGFCTKTIKRVIRSRKLDKAAYQESEAVYELYWDALEGAPLFDEAKEKIAAE